jgi:hypothetical protein
VFYLDKELKEQLASLNFKQNRFGGMEGSYNGFHFTVTDTPFNIVVIYYFLSKRIIREPQEVMLPKNADIKMICKCIIGIAADTEGQFENATSISELFLSELAEEISLDVKNRNYKKYPEIYYFQDEQWYFKSELEDFIDETNYLDYRLNYAHEQQDSVLDILEALADILPIIYSKARTLPNIELEEQKNIFTEPPEQTPYFSINQIIDYYMKYHIDLKKISDSINKIFDDLCHFTYFNDYHENAVPDEVAGMVFEWKRTFEQENGWGEEILKLLLQVHKSISQIKLL